MAAVSRSCLHICHEVTVQEKMGSLLCWIFNITLFNPACVGFGGLLIPHYAITSALNKLCSKGIFGIGFYNCCDGLVISCGRPVWSGRCQCLLFSIGSGLMFNYLSLK